MAQRVPCLSILPAQRDAGSIAGRFEDVAVERLAVERLGRVALVWIHERGAIALPPPFGR